MEQPRTLEDLFAQTQAEGGVMRCGTCGADLESPAAIWPHFMVIHGWRAIQGAHADN